ncbi:hypothetical protein KSP40_PGU021403 [Platanthera guangdongensis]|uniref:Uncharacterized protein n=1 Tax=Platanthera guangdongensis TaxID=2320717 RepID=A0ABR2M8T9_9ASPA
MRPNTWHLLRNLIRICRIQLSREDKMATAQYSGRRKAASDEDPANLRAAPTTDEEAGKAEQEMPRRSKRVAALDIFRGLTVAMMILVDGAGGEWPVIGHAPWNGPKKIYVRRHTENLVSEDPIVGDGLTIGVVKVGASFHIHVVFSPPMPVFHHKRENCASLVPTREEVGTHMLLMN